MLVNTKQKNLMGEREKEGSYIACMLLYGTCRYRVSAIAERNLFTLTAYYSVIGNR